MEYKIELTHDVIGDMTFEQFSDFCTHFGCSLEGKTRHNTWIIETDDIMNIYWLGANMAMPKSNSPLSVTVRDKILESEGTTPKKARTKKSR